MSILHLGRGPMMPSLKLDFFCSTNTRDHEWNRSTVAYFDISKISKYDYTVMTYCLFSKYSFKINYSQFNIDYIVVQIFWVNSSNSSNLPSRPNLQLQQIFRPGG